MSHRAALAAAVALALSIPVTANAEVRPSPIPLQLPTPRPTFSTGPDVDTAQEAVQLARQGLVAEQARLNAARAKAIAALQAYQDARRASVEAAAAVVAAVTRAE